ncbi:MAG: TIR domain-containing protein [Alphaproteobacteria bacterium]|nr:TIR domain-containing protein [Alphaproteobacteria bacterium]
MPDIFLSYSREDKARARLFAEALESGGFSVWWDVTLRAGEAYDEVTENALKTAKAVVVLWSKTSVTSRWVRAEATLADRNKTIMPAMIEPCDRPIMFELTQTTDLSHWHGEKDDKVWRTFVADVRKLLEVRTAPQLPAAALAPAQASQGAADDGRPAILILPFANMSGDPEQEYFSDGVTEDIITDLGKVSALSVVSRNTAFGFKGKTVAAAQIARQLGVSHILEGSVRKSGNRVRITAQLLASATDSQIWAERFDRTLDDIFAIQDEISEAIVNALKLKLAPAEKKAIEKRGSQNFEAYKLYLLARRFADQGSERHEPLIARICQKAVKLDSGFAQAWAMLASRQSIMHQRGLDVPDGSEAAERAIKLDPDLAEAYAARSSVLVRLGRFEEALAAAEEGVKRDENSVDALNAVGYACVSLGLWERGIEAYERAIALDPVGYRASGMILQAYMALGQKDNEIAAARRSLSRVEKIIEAEPDNGSALAFGVNDLATLGETERAKEWTQRAILLDPDNGDLHYNLACAMAQLKDIDGVMDLLAPFVDDFALGMLKWMDKDNTLDPVREHPRFVAMMKKAYARFEGQGPDAQAAG